MDIGLISCRICEAVGDPRWVGLLCDDEDCSFLEEPTEEACLVCTFDGVSEVVGCEIDDFIETDLLNPANIAECLFLSTDVLELEPFEAFEAEDTDFRWDFVTVFNGCGEPVFLDLVDLNISGDGVFEVFPALGEAILVEPTFMGEIEIFYDGTGRTDVGEALLIIEAFVADPEDPEFEFSLGTMQLQVFAP